MLQPLVVNFTTIGPPNWCEYYNNWMGVIITCFLSILCIRRPNALFLTIFDLVYGWSHAVISLAIALQADQEAPTKPHPQSANLLRIFVMCVMALASEAVPQFSTTHHQDLRGCLFECS